MRLRPLLIVFAAITPLFALSQNTKGPNCDASNGPSQQQGGQTPPRTTGQESIITNDRIIEMSKLGLDDDILIARIRNGSCEFQLRDADLVDLKKAGVSAKVIAAMLGAPVATSKKNDDTAPAVSPLIPGTARVASVRTMQTYAQDEDGTGSTKVRQVYRLETPNSVYDVTGWESSGFYGVGSKAGKRPALEIGEVVSYRVDPKHGQFIYLLLTNTDRKQKVEWHRFLRVGSEMK